MPLCEQCGAIHDRSDALCATCSRDPRVEGTAEGLAASTLELDAARAAGADLVGRTLLGQFQVIKQIGEGQFGAVYLALQRDVDRRAVIKVLHRKLAAEPAAVKRFLREAKALARLDHHHLVKLYNVGELEDGTPFLAMEYGGDRTLAEVLREQRSLPPARVCRLGEQICEALAEAHARGVVHRDLKPANILVSEKDGADWVKVVDVGIAKLLDVGDCEVSELTREGGIVGTPAYFSPEQSDGQKDLDGRSDLYSLGVVLYEAVSGQRPFQGMSLVDFVRAHALAKPLPLRARGVAAPALEATILRALEKEPARRFATALEMRDALRVAARGTSNRRRSTAAAVALTVVIVGAIVLWLRRAPLPPVPAPNLVIDAGVAAARIAPAPIRVEQTRLSPEPSPAPPPRDSGVAVPQKRPKSPPAPAVVRPWGRLLVRAQQTQMRADGPEWAGRADGGDLRLIGKGGRSYLATADGSWHISLRWAKRDGDRLGLLFDSEPDWLVYHDDELLPAATPVVLEPGSPTRFAFRSPARDQDLVLILKLEADSLTP